jgi:hypothetical protein
MLPLVNVLVSLVLPMMTVDTECDWRVREERDREARKEDRRKSERCQNALDVLRGSVVDHQQVFRMSSGRARCSFVCCTPGSSFHGEWTQSTEELI